MDKKKQAEIVAIKKYLLKCAIFFCIGILLTILGFAIFGDRFLNDITNTSLGKLPAYALISVWVAGLYVSGEFMTRKSAKGGHYSIINAFEYYLLFICGGIIMFFPAVIRRIMKLYSLLREHYPWEDDVSN